MTESDLALHNAKTNKWSTNGGQQMKLLRDLEKLELESVISYDSNTSRSVHPKCFKYSGFLYNRGDGINVVMEK